MLGKKWLSVPSTALLMSSLLFFVPLCQSQEVDNDVIQGKLRALSSEPSQTGTFTFWVSLDPDFINLILSFSSLR